MLRFKLVIIVSCLILLNFIRLNSQEGLNEIQKLKAENFQLRIKLAQCNAEKQDKENKIQSIELTNEQNKLIEEFRNQLGAKAEEKFDWNCLCFTPPK